MEFYRVKLKKIFAKISNLKNLPTLNGTWLPASNLEQGVVKNGGGIAKNRHMYYRSDQRGMITFPPIFQIMISKCHSWCAPTLRTRADMTVSLKHLH